MKKLFFGLIFSIMVALVVVRCAPRQETVDVIVDDPKAGLYEEGPELVSSDD